MHASSWLLTRDDLLCRLVRSGNEYVAGKRSFNRTARRENLLLALERVDINRFEGNAIQFGPMRRINPRIVRGQIRDFLQDRRDLVRMRVAHTIAL